MKRMLLRSAGFAAFAAVFALPALSADHNESPGVMADRVADLDDVYAWHTADGKIVAIVTFGGPGAEAIGAPNGLDTDVLYGVQLDTNGDFVADQNIWIRFGQDSMGGWGVQFAGIPGSTGTVSGAVGSVIDAGNGLSAMVNVFDDPFFFDFTGLVDTLSTGAVSFDATRDSFAGRNVNAIVIQMDAASVGTNVNLWATSARK